MRTDYLRLKMIRRSLAIFTAIAIWAAAVGAPVAAGSLSPRIEKALFDRIDLYANIETIGVVVSGANLPKNAQLMYQSGGETNWHTGHPLMRIDDGRLAGSLFELSPASEYRIKVLDGSTEISGSTTTKPNDLQFTPVTILHVNDDASPGGDGSVAAPYQTIQEGLNHAGPGTQVLVADGIYHEAVLFPVSGSPGNWIQVKAEGSGAILDGSDILSGNIWTPMEGKKNIWLTRLTTPIRYLARDQKRFYNYDDLQGLLQARGHDNVSMNEGWFAAPNISTLYVRSPENPSSHTWQVPRLDHAFDASSRDWLWIEGFEIRYYGSQDGCGVCMKDASHIVIRKNRIHNLQKGIFIDWSGAEERGNDTLIEDNEIYDPPVNEWPWNAVKGTGMEGTAIIIRGHIGAIVRGNDVHHFFNGIYTGTSAALENSGFAFDADIYDNHIHQIGDDALEPEGANVNMRFRDNRMDGIFVGVSLAPVTQGPVWVLRSTFANFTGRSIKWDRNSDGVVLIYHNTSWTAVQNINAMDLISPVHNAVLRNNIFQASGYAISEIPTGSTGHDWNNDNWYTTRTPDLPHFKWGNVDYGNLSAFCSASGLECSAYEDPPGLSNPVGADFTLLSSSPNIDRGVILPGINDNYSGSAPDLGAFEFGFEQIPMVSTSLRADLNPTSAETVNFIVNFSEPVTGVDTSAPFNDFGLAASPGLTGFSISSVTPVSGTTYNVSVFTGSGNGSLRLDILDDDSIVDATGTPLGGGGAGNGGFSAGESYTIEKDLPMVLDITLVDPNSTSAETVRFSVAFSEEVNGVDAGDFRLAITGGITGAGVSMIEGTGNTYSVTVITGSGDGDLRLDLLDDDSIRDVVNNPLGGAGAGNGNFSAGGTYLIDKTFPAVTSSLRNDPNPTGAANVNFTVSFSEEVTGVEPTDFVLTTTAGVTGALVANVSGSGTSYVVTVATGLGDGSLRLDCLDDDSIVDKSGKPLGGAGPVNGNFNSGEAYIINQTPLVTKTATYLSTGGFDGWVLESNENSNRGGSGNFFDSTFTLGDNAQDRQYRAILHFPTSSLPDNAVVTMVILTIKRRSLIGNDPFNTHGNILIDVRRGAYGSIGPLGISLLQPSDFQAASSRDSVGRIKNDPIGGWYWALLDGSAHPLINLIGVTQLRLRFQTDDNDDRGDDYLKFYSGDSKAQSDRPQLQIKYTVPG